MILPRRCLCLPLLLASFSGLALADAVDLSPYIGEFEIYTGDAYTRITLTAQEGELVSREMGKDEVIRLAPIAGENAVFSSEGTEHEKGCTYRFLRGERGQFQECLITCDERSMEGVRIEPGAARTYDPAHRFSVDQLQQDLQQLWHLIETEHPAPYEFTSREQFARLLAERKRDLVRPLRMAEFFQQAAPLVSRLGCGHTRLITPRGFWDAEPDRLFPLELRLLADGVFVVADYDGAGRIPAGSRIIAINGEPTADLTASLTDLVTTDGFNLTARRARLGRGFPFLYALTRGFPVAFEVSYRAPGTTEPADTSLAPITQQRLVDEMSRQQGEPLRFELLASGQVALMIIRSFAFYDRVDSFKSFVDSSMASIHEAGIQRLILDLRGNDGGDPWCTSHLLSYLIREPVPYFAREYGPYAPLAQPLARAAQPYTGHLYVLTDGESFSSTGHFCSLLKYRGIGKFVGEETGGTYACNDGSKLVELRHTRVRLNLPRESFIAAVQGLPRDQGLQPDYPIAPTGADLAAGRDAVLDYALKLALETSASK